MSFRKRRISLFLGWLLLILGGTLSALAVISARDIPLGKAESVLEMIFSYASFSSVYPMSASLGALLILLSLVIFISRRKRRASMFVTIPMFVIIYTTLLLYEHITGGNAFPEFITSRIDSSRVMLLPVAAALVSVLWLLLLIPLSSADRRIRARDEFLMRHLKRVTEEKEEEEAEDDEEERVRQQQAEDEREGQRYMKEKERLERRIQRKAEREARKDERRYQRYLQKQQAEEDRESEKKRRKEERLERRERKKIAAETEVETEDSFRTPGVESTSRYSYSPSDPLDFPSISTIPDMATIKASPENVSQPVNETVHPVTDVFAQIKEEVEREEEEKRKKEKREESTPRFHYDFSKPATFSKGGILEATIEAMANADRTERPKPGPIIGFDDVKKNEPAQKSSSFAPSGLSPDHPRYKLFEALTHKPGVSHFPSKSFVAEDETPSKESYSSTYIKKTPYQEEKKAEVVVQRKPEPVYEMQEETQAPARPADPDPFIEAPPRRQQLIQPEDEEKEIEEAPPKQESELLLSVGIGNLQSNEMGYAGISQRAKKRYQLPSPDLLVDYPGISTEIDEETRRRGEIIVDTLAQFHTEVVLDNIVKGPTVTMYEIKLREGTPVQRVRSRFDELSYNLGGVKIRILAPVPGRQAVGIEVPNARRATVGFKDMLAAFKKMADRDKIHVPMILGRTNTGEPVVIDVARMPHLLIAGTTGSGKSVCINTFICTVLYTKTPLEVRFIMIDPKVVELSIYNGIPHLLTPVITEAKKVVKALSWLCEEMDRRYNMLAHYGVRNIEGLNARISSENIPAEKLPYIVLIMDEFADLMTVVGKDIENYVARLAAKARAAGIHLVLATQRPSSDVITGTIKNNFPARIAFAVSSGTNSRIILDEGGAEQLLGKGDMLYMNPSVIGFQRIQGAFLSDDEVDAVVSFEKSTSTPDYLSEDIFADEPEPAADADDDADLSEDMSDEALYERAKEIVYERKVASASYLQRRMKIGYNRAARLIEMMEDDGIVGPQNGSKPREILQYK